MIYLYHQQHTCILYRMVVKRTVAKRDPTVIWTVLTEVRGSCCCSVIYKYDIPVPSTTRVYSVQNRRKTNRRKTRPYYIWRMTKGQRRCCSFLPQAIFPTFVIGSYDINVVFVIFMRGAGSIFDTIAKPVWRLYTGCTCLLCRQYRSLSKCEDFNVLYAADGVKP